MEIKWFMKIVLIFVVNYCIINTLNNEQNSSTKTMILFLSNLIFCVLFICFLYAFFHNIPFLIAQIMNTKGNITNLLTEYSSSVEIRYSIVFAISYAVSLTEAVLYKAMKIKIIQSISEDSFDFILSLGCIVTLLVIW